MLQENKTNMSIEIKNPAPSDTGTSRVSALLESAIRDIGIPPCPAILDKINMEMRKDDPDFKHLARIINSDVGIAAGLITIANSPFFGFRNRARSVDEALIMLGLAVSSRAIAGLVLRKIFPLTPSLERFWHASACIARLSGWLAQQDHNGIKVRADDAYTFGLFRDSGIPMLLKRFDNYPAALKSANEERSLSFTAIEDALCSTNHAVIGGLLAQSWWLPDDICLAIRHHHDYSQIAKDGKSLLPNTSRGLIATALLSEHLFQHHTGLSLSQEWIKGGIDCLQLLGIAEERLAELYNESAAIIADNE
jgi:HD-like signal output (HDOD) protein